MSSSNLLKEGTVSFLPYDVHRAGGFSCEKPREKAEFSLLAPYLAGTEAAGTGHVGKGLSPSGGARIQASPVTDASCENAGTMAEVERLRKEASRLLDEARKKGAEIEREAYDHGFAQGRKDGEELGRRQYEAWGGRIEKVLETIRMRGEELAVRYEAEIVRMILAVSKAVLHRELSLTSPEVVLDAFREALTVVMEGSPVIIRLNPRDADLVSEAMKVDEGLRRGHAVTIEADPSLEAGGCFLETRFGSVDATIEGKWQAVSGAVESILSARLGAAVKPSGGPDAEASS